MKFARYQTKDSFPLAPSERFTYFSFLMQNHPYHSTDSSLNKATMEISTSTKRIHPHSLELSRHGSVLVHMHASLVGSEHFSFTIPRKDIQLALDTLHVSDNRGATPVVSFKAPVYISTDDVLKLNSDKAWNDIVKDNQGSLVCVELCDASSIEGHLIGLKEHPSHTSGIKSSSHLLLLKDSTVSMYPVDSIASLSFLDCTITEKLERFTSLTKSVNDTKSYFHIHVHTRGSGPGELNVSYQQVSPFDPSYDISYLCYADKGNPDYGIYPCSLKCYATIRNPLHLDLQDTEFTLQSGVERHKANAAAYSGVTNSSESGSETESESNSESESETATVDERLRDTLSSSISTTSWLALIDFPSQSFQVTGKVSVKVGESIKVLLFEKRCNAGFIHLYDRVFKGNTALPSLCLVNSTDLPLEPGPLTFYRDDGKLHRGSVYKYLPVGGSTHTTYGTSGCPLRTRMSSKIEKVWDSDVIGRSMIITYNCVRTRTYELHNKENREIQLILIHQYSRSSQTKAELEGTFYGEGKSTVIEGTHRPSMYVRDVEYLLKMRAGEDYRFLVKEKFEHKEQFSIIRDFSSKLIAKLEAKKITSIDCSEKLRESLKIKRELEQIKREGRLYEMRLHTLKKHQRRKAKEEPKVSEDQTISRNGAVRQNGDSFLEEVGKIEQQIKVIMGHMDDIARREIELRTGLEEHKLEICNMVKRN